MSQDAQRFLDISHKIRQWGSINTNHSISYNDMRVSYMLEFEGNVFLKLIDIEFESTIEVIFGKILETYKLTLSKLNNEFLICQRNTQERYGKSYKIEPTQVISMAEEQLSKLDYNEAIKKKLLSGFNNILESIAPEAVINGWCEGSYGKYEPKMPEKQRIQEKEAKAYRKIKYNRELNDLRDGLERMREYKKHLGFIPYNQDINKYGFPSIDSIQELLVNSKIMARKNQNLKRVFNGKLNIEIEHDMLYLGFKYIDCIA